MVPWYEVEEYMHLEGAQLPDSNDVYEDSDNSFAGVRSVQGTAKNSPDRRTANAGRGKYTSMYGSYEEEKELKAIFEKTFGPVSSKKYSSNSRSFGNPESGSSFSGKGGKGAADSAFRQKPVTALGEIAVRPSTERTICWWTAAISYLPGRI